VALIAGTRLGPYEIQAPLGAGGMGEVYRAHDTKLNRDVALKVLLPEVADNPERLARFRREAQILASLNHPNIAHIYDLEEGDGVVALVLELVEGPTLADRIVRGAIPLDEGLPIAKQIAEALEVAHEQGIVHRDLKPANIKVRDDGAVKVLDFGLAKAMEPTSGVGSNLSAMTNSPTITSPALMTGVGLLLGTAAYMSPEQAKGKPADARSDVWAFGCVLFEMVTGARAFHADEISTTLAYVITKEPDWTALPANMPAAVRRLLRRCLEKEPRRRVQAIGDARLELDDALTSPSVEQSASATPVRSSSTLRRITPWVLTATLSALGVATVIWQLLRAAPSVTPRIVRFAVTPLAGQPLAMNGSDQVIAVTPDGTHIVYVAGGVGSQQLMVRSLDQLAAAPLRGTGGARNPVVSPDGKWIAYFSGATELRKIPINGGSSILLCRTQGGRPRGISWGPDNTIIFATSSTSTGLLRISANTPGEPTVLTKPDPMQGELDHVFPSFLPGGQTVLFTTVPSSDNIQDAQVAFLDLRSGERRVLIRGGSQPHYVEPVAIAGGSDQPGYLVYAAGGMLRAVRFDPDRLQVLSDPVPVADEVLTYPDGAAEFSISRQGMLVYVPGSAAAGPARLLTWVDRQGNEESIKADPHAYFYPRLSPDGTQIALDVREPTNHDIWIFDLARSQLRRLTSDPETDWYPVWTPNGRRIIFASARKGVVNLFWQAADNTGMAEQLTTSPNAQFPTSMSTYGVVFTEAKPGRDIYLLSRDAFPSRDAGSTNASFPAGSPTAGGPIAGSAASHVVTLVNDTANEDNGEVSVDGHWIAYQSDAGGQNQIYVKPFPNTRDGVSQISTAGGFKPLWSHDGSELFYLDLNNAMNAVHVRRTTPTFEYDNPVKLFDTHNYFVGANGRTYDYDFDRKRFLMVKESQSVIQDATAASIVVVLNWLEELKAKVPAK
jgi:serine/threonine-protein kinase